MRRLVSTDCETLRIEWSEPLNLSREQVEFYQLMIRHGAREGGQVALDTLLRADPSRLDAAYSYEARVLLAATTFGGEMRAKNPLGLSSWSERLIATTPVPTRSPLKPPAPAVSASTSTCGPWARPACS